MFLYPPAHKHVRSKTWHIVSVTPRWEGSAEPFCLLPLFNLLPEKASTHCTCASNHQFLNRVYPFLL
jgi:hypothetical protein